MKTSEKYYTDQEFKQKGITYLFTLYPTIPDADNERNGQEVMQWLNNGITRNEAQLVLMGIVNGAQCKWKHPKAVLYAIDKDCHKTRLSSCV